MRIKYRSLSYKVAMSISSFTTCLMLILLRLIKDVDDVKNSFIINFIIVALLVSINGWIIGDLIEKYFAEDKEVEFR